MRASRSAARASTWQILIAVALLIGTAASASFAANAITKVDVANKPDRVVISVDGNWPMKMLPLKASKGNYVGFEFPCKLVPKGRRVGIHDSRIYSVRYSTFTSSPPKTRVVTNTWMGTYLQYSTEWSADRKHVEISVWKPGCVPQISKPDAVSQTPTAAVEATAPINYDAVEASAEVAAVDDIPQGSDPGDEAAPELRVASTNIAAPMALGAAGLPPATVEPKVSIDFLAADVHDVLKALSVQSGANIVAGRDVGGEVTVKLSNVDLSEALAYVTQLSGCTYIQKNGTYLVGSAESLLALGEEEIAAPQVAVIALNCCSADDVIELLQIQLPKLKVRKTSSPQFASNPDGDSTQAVDSSMLVLTGSAEVIDYAKRLVNQLEDSMRAATSEQVTELYHVKYVDPEQLAATLMGLVPGASVKFAPSEGFNLASAGDIKVQSTTGATVEEKEVIKEEEPRFQALVITGRQVDVDMAMDLAAKFDTKAPQIKIDAKITSLTESGEKKLGLSWEWSDFGLFEGFTKADDNPHNVDIADKKWYRQPWSIAGKLEALIQEGEGELLAAPSITCLENKPGVFFVGDEIRYIVQVQETTTGVNITTESANVGILLKAVGDVSPDGTITLNLHPEVSTLVTEPDESGQLFLPQITRRFTDHVVRVQNGQTVVIGGLISDSEIEAMSKIPILGDIPILGKLFRHRHTQKDHSEIVMFITCSIIED